MTQVAGKGIAAFEDRNGTPPDVALSVAVIQHVASRKASVRV
ncbi:hypothetical protein [Salinicola salarius]|nr:hypothetical protein [Salinicola salarius]